MLRLCATEIGPPLSGAAATAWNGPASPSAITAFTARCPKVDDEVEMSTTAIIAAAAAAASAAAGENDSADVDCMTTSGKMVHKHRRFTVVLPVAPEAEGGPVLGLSGNFQVSLPTYLPMERTRTQMEYVFSLECQYTRRA